MSRPADRSLGVYRWLLRFLPRRLRRHTTEMEAVFGSALAEARQRGARAVVASWAGGLLDLAGAWPREWKRRIGQRGRVGVAPRERPVMLGSDVRYAVRSLSRQPAATVLVVGMLALGIAATVAVFSMINGLFFRPFPFSDADRLVFVNEKAPQWNLDMTGVNFPDFDAWRQGQRQFEALAIWDREDVNLSDGTGAERLSAAFVSHEFDDVLGVQPVLGRMFTADEDQPGGDLVVLISRGIWQERFQGDPRVLGRTLKLNGRLRTIIGVLPDEAEVYPGGTRLWIPLQGDPAQDGESYQYSVIARRKPGVTVADAEADLLRAHQPIFDTRDRDRIVSPFVLPLREINVRDFRTAASTLSIAVGLLLLVACANVAAVMLGRALARRREIGIRIAVGAGRGRLLRQLFVENLMLATLGGGLGLLLGQWAIGAIVELMPDGAPAWARFGVDARIMAFAAAMAALTAVLFGWAPALHALRGDVRAAMNDTQAGSAGASGGRRTLRALIGVEFALATILLVCGGLLVRAYDRVRDVDPGFSPEGVLTFRLSLPGPTYAGREAILAFWDRLEARLAQLPGVGSVGLVNCPPFSCHWGQFYMAEGQPPLAPGDSQSRGREPGCHTHVFRDNGRPAQVGPALRAQRRPRRRAAGAGGHHQRDVRADFFPRRGRSGRPPNPRHRHRRSVEPRRRPRARREALRARAADAAGRVLAAATTHASEHGGGSQERSAAR